MIGLLGAMEAEVSLLRDALDERSDHVSLGVAVHCGQIDGHDVVLARSGVGKVNATLAAAAIIEAGATEIVFTGVAGGTAPGIEVGDVVVADDLVQHDIDVTSLGYPRGQLLGEPNFWPTDETLRVQSVAAARSTGATVHLGRIASGDQFIASPEDVSSLRDTFGCLAAEMEGAAVAHVATKLGVPFVIVRTISDTADGSAHVDFPAFLPQAAQRSLDIVRALLETRARNLAV